MKYKVGDLMVRSGQTSKYFTFGLTYPLFKVNALNVEFIDNEGDVHSWPMHDLERDFYLFSNSYEVGDYLECCFVISDSMFTGGQRYRINEIVGEKPPCVAVIDDLGQRHTLSGMLKTHFNLIKKGPELTSDQKKDLLKEAFGITEAELKDILND